jgi:hypothetical protein
MSDKREVEKRATDLNPAAPKLDLNLTNVIKDLGRERPLGVPAPVTGLPSLDVLRATSGGSSVLRNPLEPLRPTTTDTTPRTTTTDASTATTTRDTRTTATTDSTSRPADKTTDATRVDDTVIKPVKGVLELEYGKPGFAKSLAQKDYHTLKIKNLPEGVLLKPWLDNGGYFFWFENGNDNKAHHYFPKNLQKIEIEAFVGKHIKPFTKPADELRISALQGTMAQEHKNGYGSFQNRTHPYKYGEALSGIADKALDLQEKALREGAEASPNNPYFRIYLADVLFARSIKPIIDGIKAGKDVKLDNPETIKKLDEAIAELKKAQEVCRKIGGHTKGPNRDLQQPLMPFGLNPYYSNPDAYWGGALYQSAQREAGLTTVRAWIKSGALKIELPPALPPG